MRIKSQVFTKMEIENAATKSNAESTWPDNFKACFNCSFGLRGIVRQQA